MRHEEIRAPAPGVTFREVVEGDRPFLRELYREVRAAELALTDWDEARKRAFADDQFERQDEWYRDRYPGARFLVIEREGAPIGRLYYMAGADELRLMEVTLVPGERNRGLGTAIVRSLLEIADARGLAVTLHVETFNPARNLYARLGFATGEANGIYLPMRREAASSG